MMNGVGGICATTLGKSRFVTRRPLRYAPAADATATDSLFNFVFMIRGGDLLAAERYFK